MFKIKGRVRKFGDNVDTDVISPGKYMRLPMDEFKKHVLEPLAPEFYKKVKEGDVIVAGTNFGCGSHREPANTGLQALGINCVVCDSMARLYFRNCIGLGMYPVISSGVSRLFDEDDEIEVDPEKGEVKNLTTGKTISFTPISDVPAEIVEVGGLLAYLKKTMDKKG